MCVHHLLCPLQSIAVIYEIRRYTRSYQFRNASKYLNNNAVIIIYRTHTLTHSLTHISNQQLQLFDHNMRKMIAHVSIYLCLNSKATAFIFLSLSLSRLRVRFFWCEQMKKYCEFLGLSSQASINATAFLSLEKYQIN